MYATDSAPAPPQQRHKSTLHANHRPQKRCLYGSKPQQQDDTAPRTDDRVCSAADSVTAMLQSIRSNVEQTAGNRDETADTRSSDEVRNLSFDFIRPQPASGSRVCVDGVSYSVNFANEMTASSRTNAPLLLGQVSSVGNVAETLPTSAISDAPSTVYATSVTFSEAEVMNMLFDVCSNNSAPQPAHYSSAPSAPQPKMPKYERVFLHDLPPTLPLPPVVGSSGMQYASQEEVIGPKRQKEPRELNEKVAIRNWYRQFDQKQTKRVVPPTSEEVDSSNESQLLKPKNIPFASPYIQTNDASSKVVDDSAAKDFDPSVPPPSAGSNGT